jgi:hypothetical protein
VGNGFSFAGRMPAFPVRGADYPALREERTTPPLRGTPPQEGNLFPLFSSLFTKIKLSKIEWCGMIRINKYGGVISMNRRCLVFLVLILAISSVAVPTFAIPSSPGLTLPGLLMSLQDYGYWATYLSVVSVISFTPTAVLHETYTDNCSGTHYSYVN